MTTSQKRLISTASCLIIGDEVLGGKTVDTNSAYFAKYCFEKGISLKRVEVIADDEDEIAEAVKRMSANYDFVVTSGGIGPTHDDITYSSIAKAFNLPLTLHEESFARMKKLSKARPDQAAFNWNTPSEALTAKKRMVELPLDPKRSLEEQVVFTDEKLWVPLSIVNGNVHILPGIPRLFKQMLEGYESTLRKNLADPDAKPDYRIIISTPLPESEVAGPLTKVAAQVKDRGIKVGSYPRWGKKNNTVTLVGKDKDKEYMDSLVADLEAAVKGKRVAAEGEDDSEPENQSKKPS
jgi:molybdenum cofactor synthesis domain-containing protein